MPDDSMVPVTDDLVARLRAHGAESWAAALPPLLDAIAATRAAGEMTLLVKDCPTCHGLGTIQTQMEKQMRNDDDYLKGYAAAMKYAAEFARDSFAGSPLQRCGEIMGDHFEEKCASTALAAEAERLLIAELQKVGADGLERLGIELGADIR